MAKIKVDNKIQIYEVDGTEVGPTLDDVTLTISSHWNRSNMVIITMPGMQKITVEASALEKACRNATNV